MARSPGGAACPASGAWGQSHAAPTGLDCMGAVVSINMPPLRDWAASVHNLKAEFEIQVGMSGSGPESSWTDFDTSRPPPSYFWIAPGSFRTCARAMNLVGQPFQAAGSTGFPARRTHWGLESPQNRQARKPALQGRGSWEVSTRSRPPPGRLRATAVTFRKRPRREPATVATSRNRTERQSSTVATSSHWPREFPATVATFDHQPGRFCATVATSRNQLGEFPSTVATSRNRRRTFFPTVATSSKPPGRFFATCGTCQQ